MTVSGSLHHGERGPPSSPEAAGRLPGIRVDAGHSADAPRLPPGLRPKQQGQDRIQTPPQVLLADRQSTCHSIDPPFHDGVPLFEK